MFRWHGVDDLVRKVKIVHRSFKPTAYLGLRFERLRRLLLDSHLPVNNFNTFMQVAPLCLNVHRCNLIKVSRNFSTTEAVWNHKKTNQDKERFKNYLCFVLIAFGALFVLYMNLTMERNQDYVILENEESEK